MIYAARGMKGGTYVVCPIHGRRYREANAEKKWLYQHGGRPRCGELVGFTAADLPVTCTRVVRPWNPKVRVLQSGLRSRRKR